MKILVWNIGNKDHDEIIQRLENIKLDIAEALEQIARINASVDAGNAALSGIQSDIADLKAQLAAGGLTAEQEAQVAAELTALETKIGEQAAALSALDAENPPA